MVLTAHLVQPVFYALRKQTWDALSADSEEGRAAPRPVLRPRSNDEARLDDEKQVADGSRRRA